MNPKYKRKRKKHLIRISLRLILFLVSIFSLIFIVRSIGNESITNNKVKATEENNIKLKDDDNNKSFANNNVKFTVAIDPGHGGYDVGTISSAGVFEKDVTLKIALKVGRLLEKDNIKVVYTRKNDTVSWPSNTKADLKERVKISNEAKADLFVSIHANSNTNTSYKGVEAWCRAPNTEGEKLARNIQKELANYNYTTDRGIKYETEGSLAVFKLNNATSTLVELGFLSNSSDAEFITSESGQDKCAEAIEKGILNYKASYKK